MRENARAYEAHRNFMCTTIPSAQWGKRLYGVAIIFFSKFDSLREADFLWNIPYLTSLSYFDTEKFSKNLISL